MEIITVINVNNRLEEYATLTEARNRVDELRRQGIDFKIYNLVKFNNEVTTSELSKNTKKYIFRKLHHMTIKKMFRIKAEMEEQLWRYNNDLKEWKKEYNNSSSEFVKDYLEDRIKSWNKLIEVSTKSYKRHLQKMYEDFIITEKDVRRGLENYTNETVEVEEKIAETTSADMQEEKIAEGRKRRKFEDLTEVEKMILALKGAIEEAKIDKENEMFYASFIVATMEQLKQKGLSKEEIFNYRVDI